MIHLNERNRIEREKWEKSHEALVKSIESRHKDQLDQMKSEIARLNEEIADREH